VGCLFQHFNLVYGAAVATAVSGSWLCGIGTRRTAPWSIPRISERVVRAVVATLHITPLAATDWSTLSMAEAQGLSRATIRRIWKRHNFKLHLVKVFKISCDQYFVEKLQDVIGLYLNPRTTPWVRVSTNKAKSSPSTAPSQASP
jgi:hypothetical protein